MRNDGKIFLAPRFAEFADANLAYLLIVAPDSRKSLRRRRRSNAKVLRVDPAGKATTAFESQELSAQALAIDTAGNLLLGTSSTARFTK